MPRFPDARGPQPPATAVIGASVLRWQLTQLVELVLYLGKFVTQIEFVSVCLALVGCYSVIFQEGFGILFLVTHLFKGREFPSWGDTYVGCSEILLQLVLLEPNFGLLLVQSMSLSLWLKLTSVEGGSLVVRLGPVTSGALVRLVHSIRRLEHDDLVLLG